MSDQPTSTSNRPTPARSERNIYLVFTLLIQLLIGVGLVMFILRRDWEDVFLTAIVMLITLVPMLLYKQFGVVVPPEFELVAVAFVFLSLYLGSAFDLYYRFWWWDIVLHTSSGALLGFVGFVAIFLLNRTDRLPVGMTPAFIAVFGVTFAVTLGVFWEIFEYVVDVIAPEINMQSRETNVVDTMHDLIVDTIGAVIVAFMGYAYLRTGRYSFIADGVQKFVRANPGLFPRREKPSS